MKKNFLSLIILFVFYNIYAQNCQNLNFELKSEIETTCSKNTMTMLHDRFDRPYLYVANKENGLTIWDIQDVSSPILVKQFTTIELGNADVMNLSQNDKFLYLALGNFFNNSQLSGMGIINIEDPLNAFIEDTFFLSNNYGGSGAVISDGNYAYLSAMGNGLIVLDVNNKSSISFKSQFIPQINWPDTNQDPSKVNARGLTIRNDTVFLCYDAGGLRIIDVSQKTNPIEIGRFSNSVMNNLPRAYNNIEINENLAYVTVDYCGLEIIDFSELSNIILKGWWNPYNCPSNNWFTSPIHANELRLKKECNELFISVGKSDAIVLDVSNPNQPDSCNYYGGVDNGIGTWGIDVFKNRLFLSYICTIGIPFTSNWSGFKCINFTECINGITENEISFVNIYPNPIEDFLYFNTKHDLTTILIENIIGDIVVEINYENIQSNRIDLSFLSPGTYFINFKNNNYKQVFQFVKKL